MYEIVDQADVPIVNSSRRGAGRKTPERLAMESLTAGKAVYIPKANAPRGSMNVWSQIIGKEHGLAISVYSVGDNWLVSANIRTD